VHCLFSELLELSNSFVEQVRDSCQVDSGAGNVGLEALFAGGLSAEEGLLALGVDADADDWLPALALPLGLSNPESLQLGLQLFVGDLLVHQFILIMQ
jgi:hypothetical protein